MATAVEVPDARPYLAEVPALTHRIASIASVALLVSAVAACDQGAGGLRGAWLQADDCKRIGESTRYEPFDMPLEFASITQRLDTALIRMSPSSRLIGKGDQVAVTVNAVEPVNEGIAGGGSFVLRLAADGSGDAHLTLTLLGRCTHAAQALAAEGTLTLYEYGWQRGARVRGEMAFDLVDRRSGAVVGEGFVGEFDFESLTGSPWTAFSPHDYR